MTPFGVEQVIIRCGNMCWLDTSYAYVAFNVEHGLVATGHQEHDSRCSSEWPEDWGDISSVADVSDYYQNAIDERDYLITCGVARKPFNKTGYVQSGDLRLMNHFLEWYKTKKYTECCNEYLCYPLPPYAPVPKPAVDRTRCHDCNASLTNEPWVSIRGGVKYQLCDDCIVMT